MKTKTIFKALALAMLMPAMMLTTACSSSDDAAIDNNNINTENTAKKGYALPVTVNVTRQGDAAGTRATFDGSKLNFSAGDKLFVRGSHTSAGKFAGTLTWQSSDTFTGTIYTENNYSGSADEFFTAASTVEAHLQPNGYESIDFISIGNNDTPEALYDDCVIIDGAKAFATSKAVAVEQFSHENTDEYSDGFALKPDYAILCFAITDLEARTDFNVSFSYNPTFGIGGSVGADEDGTATFAIGVSNGTSLSACDLVVDGKNFNLGSGADLAAGKIYNVGRAMGHALSQSEIGEIVGTDGLAYAVAYKDKLPTGVTAAGMVACKDEENYDKGLVIALANKGSMDWDTACGASGAAAHTPAVTGYSLRSTGLRRLVK